MSENPRAGCESNRSANGSAIFAHRTLERAVNDGRLPHSEFPFLNRVPFSARGST